MPTTLKIDFVSDVSCPWCIIGLRGLTGGGNGATAQVLASLVISMNQGAANAGSLVVGIQYQVVNQDGKWKISRVDAW